jgi:hypothetical protein
VSACDLEGLNRRIDESSSAAVLAFADDRAGGRECVQPARSAHGLTGKRP